MKRINKEDDMKLKEVIARLEEQLRRSYLSIEGKRDAWMAAFPTAVEVIRQQQKMLQVAVEALSELVALKDGKGKAIPLEEYESRKEPAWEAARQALATLSEEGEA